MTKGSPASISTTQRAVLRVLLVDDDADFYFLLRRWLSETAETAELDWASSLERSLQAVREKPHSLYLVSYTLGQRRGFEFLKKAAAAGVVDPVIVLAPDEPGIFDEGLRLGAADVLSKHHLDAAGLWRSMRYAVRLFDALRALRTSQAQLAGFMKNIPCAVFIKDREGRYAYLNAACERYLRRTTAECLGRRDTDIFPSQQARRVEELDAQLARELRAIESHEVVEEPAGIRHWWVTRFPILDEPGTPLLAGGAAIDITERRELEKELVEVSDREKRRIGQDLHDGLGQRLTGIACLARALEQQLDAKKSPEARDAGRIATLVNQAIGEARDLARGLAPVELERQGLAAALSELAGSTERLFQVTCAFTGSAPDAALDAATALHVFRIAQEAINNAVKHGAARRIDLRLALSGDRFTFTVEDDGRGLAAGRAPIAGLGLRAMRDRAGMIGGVLELEARKPRGVRVRCQFPVPKAKAGNKPAMPSAPSPRASAATVRPAKRKVAKAKAVPIKKAAASSAKRSR